MGVIGVALGLCIAITGWIASSAWGTRLDNELQNAFARRDASGLFRLAFRIDNDVEDVVILVGTISFVLAWLRPGPRCAISIVASVALAAAIAGVLKQLVLVRPSGVRTAASSWPSGHASALVALDVSVLMLPRRLSARWFLSVVAGGYLVIVCASLLAVRAHQLTDVISGCLTGAWAVVTVAAILDPWANRASLWVPWVE
jgi:membrane-associated phospholipid phosphatase